MANVKIKIVNPIIHDGIEYDRGIHEVPEALAKLWAKNAPHVLEPIDTEVIGKAKPAPDAPKKAPEKAPEVVTNESPQRTKSK